MKLASVRVGLWLPALAPFMSTWPAFAQGAATTLPAQIAQTDTAIEIAKALAWPIAAIALGILFHKPVAAFLVGISSRITKVSVFKVEFELVPGATATAIPLIDEIRGGTNAAQIHDSTQGLIDQLRLESPADFATVYLGDGQEWITSRLFLAALMMKRMRGIKALVFLEKSANGSRRFVAVALVDDLVHRLAQHYPWLEAAWGTAVSKAVAPSTMAVSPMDRNPSGAFTAERARQVVVAYIASLQQPIEPTFPANPSEWTNLTGSIRERAVNVTTQLLRDLLPSDAFSASMDAQLDTPRAKRNRILLRRRGDFVAVLGQGNEFWSLVNRRALLDEIGRAMAEEPE